MKLCLVPIKYAAFIGEPSIMDQKALSELPEARAIEYNVIEVLCFLESGHKGPHKVSIRDEIKEIIFEPERR